MFKEHFITDKPPEQLAETLEVKRTISNIAPEIVDYKSLQKETMIVSKRPFISP